MKGIILAGGSGTRLGALTVACSKQLLPVYDEPMICYPLHTLLLAGIRDILIISTPRDTPRIRDLLGYGNTYGARLTYAVQTEPRGIAEALIIGESHIRGGPCCLILGDNLFLDIDNRPTSAACNNLGFFLKEAAGLRTGARVFACRVSDPRRFGVVEFDSITGLATSIEEKPAEPRSMWAVTGIYFYDGRATSVARGVVPSNRGELEITDVNRWYMEYKSLYVTRLGLGHTWMDMGTPDSLLAAGLAVQRVKKGMANEIHTDRGSRFSMCGGDDGD